MKVRKRETLTIIVTIIECQSLGALSLSCSQMAFFVPMEDNVGMWCSLARPVSLLHPSLMPLLSVYKSLGHNYPHFLLLSFTLHLSRSLRMSVWNTITPVLPLSFFHFIHPSPFPVSLSISYGFRRSLWREQLLKYLLICFPQFYLFLPLPSCSPFPFAQTWEHLQRHEMSEAAARLKIHNIKPLFSICCTQ